MAATDITGPVARIEALISGLPSIGLVYGHDIFDRTDLQPRIVSNIGGTNRLRVWWVSGPTMVGRPMVQTSAGYIERTWRYTICGAEGLADDGSSIVTLRANALAVADALDADHDLAGSCHRSQPCRFETLENRVLWAGIAASFVQLSKEIVTLSTP